MAMQVLASLIAWSLDLYNTCILEDQQLNGHASAGQLDSFIFRCWCNDLHISKDIYHKLPERVKSFLFTSMLSPVSSISQELEFSNDTVQY